MRLSLSSFFVDVEEARAKLAHGEPISVWHPADGPDKKGNTLGRLCLCGGVLHRQQYQRTAPRWSHDLGTYVVFIVCRYLCTSCGCIVVPHVNGVVAYLHCDASTIRATVDTFLKTGGRPYTTAVLLNRVNPRSPHFEPTWIRRKITTLKSKMRKLLSEEATAHHIGIATEFLREVPALEKAFVGERDTTSGGCVAIGVWGAVRAVVFHARCGGAGGGGPPMLSIPPLWL